jgi:hypothetical protein
VLKPQYTPAPASRPSTTLTGYSDTTIGDNAQTLAWSSQSRPKDLPIPEYSQQNRRNLSLSRVLNGPDTSLDAGVGQTFYNQPISVGAFTPPSLTSKSTPSSLQSTLSTESGDSQSQRSTATYFAPRKPLEESFDRLFLPIPRNLSDARASEAYPCRTGILAVDYSTSGGALHPEMHTIECQSASLQQLDRLTMDNDLTFLDPISALLRAGDILSSQGRPAHPQHQPVSSMTAENKSRQILQCESYSCR